MSNTSAFTAAAWIKLGSGPAQPGAIVSFNNAAFFQLNVTPSSGSGYNFIQFQTKPTEESLEQFTHSRRVNDGKWHLVVATYDGGLRTLYIDGVPERQGVDTDATVGDGTPYYGMIGARSTATSFGAAAQSPFFSGNMAEVALWNSVVDSFSVVDMMKNGIQASGPAAHWVLNDLPSRVSPAQDDVFSDFGNLSAEDEWARVYGLAWDDLNAPVLYTWDPDDFPDTELKNIPQGTYELTVKDQFACDTSAMPRTYTVGNNDQEPPELLTNIALRRSAIQSSDSSNASCGATTASLAVDGYLDNDYDNCTVSGTQSGSNQYWQVNLGYSQRVKQVVVYHASVDAPDDYYVIVSRNPIAGLGDLGGTGIWYEHFTGAAPAIDTFF